MKEMVRKHCLGILLVCLVSFPVVAQPHLSEAFALEAEWLLEQNGGQIESQGMVGCVCENTLYCCHRRGFHNKEEGYQATVCTIDLFTGAESSFTVSLPDKKVNATIARKYWIRGICVEGNQLLLMVQNAVLVYQKGRGGRYEFVRKTGVELPDRLHLDKGRLTIVERVPEEGRFVVRQQRDRLGVLDSVRDMTLPGPFMVQYEPNGFVKLASGGLYFLASPEFRIEKYSYRGVLETVIEPKLPEWVAMPEALRKKLSEMPYGSDRAMYTFSQVKTYSFPLEVCPLADSVLLVAYHHYHSSEKKEQVLSVLVHYDREGDVKGIEGPFSHFFSPDSVIGAEEFPLYYARRELCLQVVDGDRIIQVVREAPVEWRGKTGKQYADSAERFFADHAPVVRVRVARLKTAAAEHACKIGDLGLRTYIGEHYTGSEHRDKKAVFVLNNPPQCHNCEESLLAFMNTLDTVDCKLFVVFNNADSYLAKRDQIESVRKHLAISFTPLFVPTEGKDKFLKAIGVSEFPAIMLKDVGNTDAMVFSGIQLYEAGHSSSLNQTFVRKVMQVLHRKGGVGE